MSTLTQLGYAVAVDRHRSFGRAAKACFVTQPTLSTQLLKLEDELGVTLFDRSRKPVVPTPEGAPLLAQFRRVLSEHARIQELVDELQGDVCGTYRLGIIPTMAPTILPRLIPDFLAAHPAVELHIEELTTQAIIAGLLNDNLDGGILATPLDDPRIYELPVAREDLLVYHSAQLPLTTNDEGRVSLETLPMDRLIVMREGHCLRTQVLDLCALGDQADSSRRFTLEAGSMATLCNMVRRGHWFTILPALAAHELAASGQADQVKPLAGLVPFREVSLVTRRTENRRAVREALLAEAKRALLQGPGPLLQPPL